MFDFMIIFNWISLFAAFASRTHIIIKTYFFFLWFLANHFTLSIYNSECMISSIFSITFALSFLMFWNMLLIFISCIIISNLSRLKIVVIATFLIQKSFDFSIFLFSSKIILKIINFLNLLISTIFFRADNVFIVFNSRVNAIIFAAFIFCIFFISWFFLIHIINFIFLLSRRFESALIANIEDVENATFTSLKAIFVQVFFSVVLIVFSVILFNFLAISSNLVICFSESQLDFFVSSSHSWRVAFFIKTNNFVNVVYDIISVKFFFFNS